MNSLNSLKGRNLTMLVDFYEMTMANGYLKNGMGDTVAYFDMFFRKVPDGGGYVIMAGIEQLCEYLKGLKFTPEDIEYLRVKGFSEEFLDYLADFKFSCDVYAVPEGTPIFPGGADSYRQRTDNAGSVRGDDGASVHQSSKPYRHQGEQNSPRRAGQTDNGVRFAPRPGL